MSRILLNYLLAILISGMAFKLEAQGTAFFYQGQLTAGAVLPPPPSGPADIEGELSFNTVSYGVGNWRIYNHNASEATGLFRNVVKGEAWNSWGFIGSEVELTHGAK